MTNADTQREIQQRLAGYLATRRAGGETGGPTKDEVHAAFRPQEFIHLCIDVLWRDLNEETREELAKGNYSVICDPCSTNMDLPPCMMENPWFRA